MEQSFLELFLGQKVNVELFIFLIIKNKFTNIIFCSLLVIFFCKSYSQNVPQLFKYQDAVNKTISALLFSDAQNNWIKVVSDGTNWISFRALY